MSEDESHRCQMGDCSNTVPYDDEPYCYTHSPDSGSTVRGYSFKKSAEALLNSRENSPLRLVCDTAVSWAGEYGFSQPEEAKKVLLAVYVLDPETLDAETKAWAEKQ